MKDIKDVDAIKVYYPFLMEQGSTLEPHVSNFKSLLLLGEKLILPPRHVFNSDVAKINLDAIQKRPDLCNLFTEKQLVTTSPEKQIRDSQDLVEEYSGSAKLYKEACIPLRIYRRSVDYQKQRYTEFVLGELGGLSANFFDQEKLVALTKYISQEKSHSQILAKIKRLNFHHRDAESIKALRQLLDIAYLKGGADGNVAIMPGAAAAGPLSFFNEFYGLNVSRSLAQIVSKKLRQDFNALNPDQLSRILVELSAFRKEYYRVTEILKGFESTVAGSLKHFRHQVLLREIRENAFYAIKYFINKKIESWVVGQPLPVPEPHTELALSWILDKTRIIDRLVEMPFDYLSFRSDKAYARRLYRQLLDQFYSALPKPPDRNFSV